MAHLDRTAKLASEWTDHELDAYNITTASVPPHKFFPLPDPPLDHLDPTILDRPVRPEYPGLSADAHRFFSYLKLAEQDGTRYMAEFVNDLQKLLDFNEGDVVGVSRENIPFAVSGSTGRTAQADVCLVDFSTPRTSVFPIFAHGPEAQVVATAIAAFRWNNRTRAQIGADPLRSMTFPCFNMACRTRPTFYLVPVTEELSNAVLMGRYPTTATRVSRCETAPINDQTESVGMEDPQYRRLALSRLVAFRELARSCWQKIVPKGPDTV
ncbi:hypothetical protein BJ912DRAFT_979211 [Pholiota molesta]|nr:hypothetical protein BJ912DRAFT_979211 [Pholiota molesta]